MESEKQKRTLNARVGQVTFTARRAHAGRFFDDRATCREYTLLTFIYLIFFFQLLFSRRFFFLLVHPRHVHDIVQSSL